MFSYVLEITRSDGSTYEIAHKDFDRALDEYEIRLGFYNRIKLYQVYGERKILCRDRQNPRAG